jgi:hypothetical protein
MPLAGTERAGCGRQCQLAFPNEARHRTPHEPARKLLRKSRNPLHDHTPAPNGGVVLDVSQPDTVEERQICTDDQVGIEPRWCDTHGNLAAFEQQPHPPPAGTRKVELDNRARFRQQLAIDPLVDLAWTPLFPTPPHPEYLSGHTTNSSAMATALQLLFGDEPSAPVIVNSATNPGFERRWARLSEGVEEVIEARIYAGIHYRSSDEDGAAVGRKIARFVVNRALRVRHELKN